MWAAGTHAQLRGAVTEEGRGRGVELALALAAGSGSAGGWPEATAQGSSLGLEFPS